MTVLDKLRERNRADVTLTSGLRVGLQLKPMRYAFVNGVLPVGAVDEVIRRRPELADKPAAIAEELAKSDSEAVDWASAQRAYVAGCVETIDGEEVEMTADDTEVFSDDEYFEIVAYVMRTKPLPGKA